mgnify:CR=1 FL=1
MRAYSFLTIKELDREERRISGWASRPEVDRVGDVVEPMGLQPAKGTINLLLDHDHARAVGIVESVTPSSEGVRFTAKIAKITQPGALKSMCDDAWEMVREKLRAAVSIGFRPLDAEPMTTGGMRFKSWQLLELSLVSVPACASATIDQVKHYARQTSPRGRVVRIPELATTKQAHRVVRLDSPPLGVKADNDLGPVSSALVKTADEIERDLKTYEDIRKMGPTNYARVLNDVDMAKASDRTFAEIMARLDKLEQRK